MKGILLDPENETIEVINYDGDYKELQKIVADGGYFCVGHTFENNDTLWVDDEGLLKDPKYFFWIEGMLAPLAGKGLILGTDEIGDSVSCETVLSDLQDKVEFMNYQVAYAMHELAYKQLKRGRKISIERSSNGYGN